jgi:hypothetical protein
MAEAAQGCGGTTILSCYNMESTKVEGTTSTFSFRYRSGGEGLPRAARGWSKIILNTRDLRQNQKVLFIDR